MQVFMLYMSGSTLQVFSITMTYMLFANAFQAIYGMPTVFSKLESPTIKLDLLLCKGAFVVVQLMFVLLGVWKCNQMGILPTTRSDWLAWESFEVYPHVIS